MRLILASCQVDYAGRLTAHLPKAKRLIMLKADGAVLIHSDGGSYKPLNWMSPPCTLRVESTKTDIDAKNIDAEKNSNSTEKNNTEPIEIWRILQEKTGDTLQIKIFEIFKDIHEDLGIDPGLKKDGVESHLQQLLAQSPQIFGKGYTLVRREYPTAIGPVDLLLFDEKKAPVAVEVKRRGEIDGVEQLTRYLELLRRHDEFAQIRGIFAAQEIKKQARTLAEDRGIECVVLDYDELRGIDDPSGRLF